MKNFCAVFVASFFVIFSVFAADTYKFDPNHISINWSAGHFGFSHPSGKFTNADGVIILDEKNPQNSSVKVTVYIPSLNTGLAKFDEHLKGPDFFDAEKYSTAKFESTIVKITGRNTAKVTGNFTLRGVTEVVVLDVKLNKIGNNPFTQVRTAGFSASTTIKRSKFRMSFGLPGISDEVKINIEAEGIYVASDESAANISWKIIPSKSSLNFTAQQEKSMVSGSFKKFEGKINFDPQRLSESNIAIEIDTASIDTSFAEAINVIQEPTWLSTAAFSKAVFKSDKIIRLSEKDFRAEGTLSLKGKTVPVKLEFTLKEYGKGTAHATGKAVIKRSDFGIGDRDQKKANGIQDEVTINVEIFAEK